MRQLFFLGVLVFGTLAIIGYFGWKVCVSLFIYFRDGSDSRATAKINQVILAKKEVEDRERLSNDCNHRFGEKLGGFPPFACRSCGLEKSKPSGGCDHVWRLDMENAPGAVCELCKKTYKPIISERTKL